MKADLNNGRMTRRPWPRGSRRAWADVNPGTHHALPVAPSSPDPYAKLQGGAPHHMTPEQESQRVTDSTAPAGRDGSLADRYPALFVS